MNSPDSSLQVAIAAHRFGLGEPGLEGLRADPSAWLRSQIGPADAALGKDLVSSGAALQTVAALQRERQRARARSAEVPVADVASSGAPMADDELALRQIIQADQRSRLITALASQRPFAERLTLFWANHFTVSLAKNSARALVGSFEREAIRPNIAGSFETLLKAAVTHPGLLRYLDNHLSAGPHSRVAERSRRISGLNENLAREVLELHTLGVGSGYRQADVSAFAALLTGWRPGPAGSFDPRWHEPGPKDLLGKRYPEGAQALDAVLRDLARHPSTARFVCAKLARHVVADDPPPALVERLASTWRRSDGELAQVYATLIESPEAWAGSPAKLKSPEEFVVSSARCLALPLESFAALALQGQSQMGQPTQRAPSPAGWPDRAEDWLGPDALWKRIEWSHALALRVGTRIDARERAQRSLGPLLTDATRTQIERAADGPQALTLWLMSSEFQRR